MLTEILVLLILFQVKHFTCDYPLQNAYMLGKMNKTGWIKPLATHAYIHMIGTYFVGMVWMFTFNRGFAWVIPLIAIADFVLHFIVDRLKASPDLGGRWKPDQPYFWWALGADQMAHHLINYAFIAILVSL